MHQHRAGVAPLFLSKADGCLQPVVSPEKGEQLRSHHRCFSPFKIETARQTAIPIDERKQLD